MSDLHPRFVKANEGIFLDAFNLERFGGTNNVPDHNFDLTRNLYKDLAKKGPSNSLNRLLTKATLY